MRKRIPTSAALLIAAFGISPVLGDVPQTAPKPPAKATATKPAAKPAAKPTATKPTAAKPADSTAKPTTPAAVPSGTVKQSGKGEMDVNITGKNKEKLVVGKFDPPAAFNLEDIQNFPEDRLQPLLNAPVTFNEGRDFSRMMDFKDDQPVHPWLPEISRAPFLAMKSPPLEKAAKEWNYAIIDQAGATVYKISGKGAPPDQLSWPGEDSMRGRVAVDTVYIPQLNTIDKEGYHHTYMGQPIQFSSLAYNDGGKMVIELSSKRLFGDRKSEFSKEGPMLLDKVCDVIREGSHLPFAIQPYSNDDSLARSRQQTLLKYFKEKLFIPENQIVMVDPQDATKRGDAIGIMSNAVPGGSAQ
jgi:hypothetical protein